MSYLISTCWLFVCFSFSSITNSDSYSNFSTPTSQLISSSASRPQTRIHTSILLDTSPSTSVASLSFLFHSLNLQYLSLSTLFKLCSCSSEFKAGSILLEPTVLKATGWQYKGEGVLAFIYIIFFCSCLQQLTAAPTLKSLLTAENVKNGTCSSKWTCDIQNCKTDKIVLRKGELSFWGRT